VNPVKVPFGSPHLDVHDGIAAHSTAAHPLFLSYWTRHDNGSLSIARMSRPKEYKSTLFERYGPDAGDFLRVLPYSVITALFVGGVVSYFAE
jgi:hypothetical protein